MNRLALHSGGPPYHMLRQCPFRSSSLTRLLNGLCGGSESGWESFEMLPVHRQATTADVASLTDQELMSCRWIILMR